MSEAAGVFITFEGGDGSGKTLQSKLLAEKLSELGYEVLLTREPGGTELGLELRKIVLHSRGLISAKAEALIYAADRAQHIATLVRPALNRGAIVIQDRYIDSSIAYQGAGRVLGADEVGQISYWATDSLKADRTFLLDVDEETARSRIEGERTLFDRLEAEGESFHQSVRNKYLELAKQEPERFVVLDARESIEQLSETISNSALELVKSLKGN